MRQSRAAKIYLSLDQTPRDWQPGLARLWVCRGWHRRPHRRLRRGILERSESAPIQTLKRAKESAAGTSLVLAALTVAPSTTNVGSWHSGSYFRFCRGGNVTAVLVATPADHVQMRTGELKELSLDFGHQASSENG